MNNTFEAWMTQVDDALIRRCGMSSEDLPDYCYRDAYEDEASPRVCAILALANAE